MHTRFHAEHDSLRSLLRELEGYLDSPACSADARFATLRWTLLREHLCHSKCERAYIDRQSRGGVIARTHRNASEKLDAMVKEQARTWTAINIPSDWNGYCTATRKLIARMRSQMAAEEQLKDKFTT